MNTIPWDSIEWIKVEEVVFNVQRNIYFAIKSGNIAQARNLQLLLLNMYETKLYAVKIVTTNSGGKSPGIDKWLALNDDDKFMLVNGPALYLDGTSNFIRRVYIPKPGTKDKRPLGIPTIIDRCKQCIVKLILEPEAEAKFEGNSFGFRPGRSAIDAVSKIRAWLIFNGPCYVLDTDIRKCFDMINHDQLKKKVATMPIIEQQLDAWLRAGIFDKNEIAFPREGTPQGGIISPLLANIALDGMQNYISLNVKQRFGFNMAKSTYFIRYADDLVAFAPTLEVIQYIKLCIATFLNGIGLEMKPEATRIIYTLNKDTNGKIKSEYFDFLGFRFKQRFLSKHITTTQSGITGTRTYVLVDPSRIQRHKASINAILSKLNSVESIVQTLNARIAGWCEYFRHSDAKDYGDLPRKLDLWLNGQIRKWIRKKTKIRGKDPQFWLKNRKSWTLYYLDSEKRERVLHNYGTFVSSWSIYDYKAINTSFSPFQQTFKQLKNKRISPEIKQVNPE